MDDDTLNASDLKRNRRLLVKAHSPADPDNSSASWFLLDMDEDDYRFIKEAQAKVVALNAELCEKYGHVSGQISMNIPAGGAYMVLSSLPTYLYALEDEDFAAEILAVPAQFLEQLDKDDLKDERWPSSVHQWIIYESAIHATASGKHCGETVESDDLQELFKPVLEAITNADETT